MIKEVCDRKNLQEGRSSGMGFAFLKKISEDEYETVQPISPCKDYLNEVVFTENYDIGTQAYGLAYHKKLGIFTKTKAYMGIEIQKKGQYYHNCSTFEIDSKMLSDNYKNIELFLQEFDKLLDNKTLTKIIPQKEGKYLVEIPIEWVQSTIAISMYTLLMRVVLNYDGKEDIWEYLTKISKDKKNIDQDLLKGAIPQIKAALEDSSLLVIPEEHLQSANQYLNKQNNVTDWSPHNYGIRSLQIKKEVLATV
jgi:hypothetical protein